MGREWSRLHSKELQSLYLSPNIDRVIKSRRLKWAGHVARMEEGKSAFKWAGHVARMEEGKSAFKF